MANCKVAVLIDGGFLRVVAKRIQKTYDPDFIESFAHHCREADEDIFRILYYDCAMYSGTVKLPVSGNAFEFTSNDNWLHALSRKNLFAVRRGVLKFRGYKPRKTPVGPTTLTDNDFTPDFEQKGVDMRIGLDIAAYSANHAADHSVERRYRLRSRAEVWKKSGLANGSCRAAYDEACSGIAGAC